MDISTLSHPQVVEYVCCRILTPSVEDRCQAAAAGTVVGVPEMSDVLRQVRRAAMVEVYTWMTQEGGWTGGTEPDFDTLVED